MGMVGLVGVMGFLGLALAFVIVFVLLVLACLGSTLIILVLYGFRTATYETALGLGVGITAGVLADLAGYEAFVILTVMGGFVGGFWIGRRRWANRSPAPQLQGNAYAGVLSLAALTGIGSGLLFWVVLLAMVGFELPATMLAHPPGALALVAVTAAPVVSGGYVLWVLHGTHPRNIAFR